MFNNIFFYLQGLTMLMQASIQGNEDVLLTLLNKGADINILVCISRLKYDRMTVMYEIITILFIMFNALKKLKMMNSKKYSEPKI